MQLARPRALLHERLTQVGGVTLELLLLLVRLPGSIPELGIELRDPREQLLLHEGQRNQLS